MLGGLRKRKHYSGAEQLRVLPGHRDGGVSIDVKNFSVFAGKKQLVNNIEFTARPGEITVLMGPSGAGKSSLLEGVAGLNVHRGTTVTGDVLLADAARHELVPAAGLAIGYVFQQPNPFPLSIAENIEFPLREHGVKDKARRRCIVGRVLRDVGLWDEVSDRLSDSALTLSGGQQQRLCIARALALSPRALLLDEPCSSLDPLATQVIEQLLLKLREKYTIILVTHNLAQAQRVGDQCVVLWPGEAGGEIVECGRCDETFCTPKHDMTKLLMQSETTTRL